MVVVTPTASSERPARPPGAAGVAQGSLAVDHVPIAVRSLPAVEDAYRRLGFRLKGGRSHTNGLRNAFAKFPDGSYLELIAPERGATDALTRSYVGFLARREGGAFLAFRAASLERLARRLEEAGHAVTLNRGTGAFATLGFDEAALGWLFLIDYGSPPADAPELTSHPNTALGIETAWLSRGTYQATASLGEIFTLARIARSEAPEGEDAPVVGVTLRVGSVVAARDAVRAGRGIDLPIRDDPRGRSVLVPAAAAHGMWIELLEPATASGPRCGRTG